MFTRLFLAVALIGLASGCTLNKSKEEPATEIKDLSTKAPGTDEMENGVAQAYGTGDSSTSDFSTLYDTLNPPSEQIIYFEYDSSYIQSDYRGLIEAHATYLSTYPDAIVILEGHADERGSREYNLALGESRARAVKDHLILLGASPEQIRMISYGEERPTVAGHNETAWQQNRRVEIIY